VGSTFMSTPISAISTSAVRRIVVRRAERVSGPQPGLARRPRHALAADGRRTPPSDLDQAHGGAGRK
jgi:hypothetical protein